jgi:hypothetical protein
VDKNGFFVEYGGEHNKFSKNWSLIATLPLFNEIGWKDVPVNYFKLFNKETLGYDKNVFLFICFICLFVLFIYLFVCLFCLFIYLFVCLFISV